MQNGEYKIESLDTVWFNAQEQILNVLCKKGWELVTVSASMLVYIFKHPFEPALQEINKKMLED